MRLFEFPLLADENIHPAVVRTLKERGLSVVTVQDLGLIGQDDSRIMKAAANDGRVVITQDRNVGRVQVLSGEYFPGIVCVRPGGGPWARVLRVLQAVHDHTAALRSPFLVVGLVDGDEVRIRVRLSEP